MNKNILIILSLVIIAAFGIGIWMWQSGKQTEPGQSAGETTETVAETPTPPKEDSTAAINQALDTVDLGDLDAEFKDIDADLNSL